ncbi:MAG: DUF4446 family protein [Anaerolineae bacterium]|nr:DUF4446 family protein [Anaerolineae bacterium]
MTTFWRWLSPYIIPLELLTLLLTIALAVLVHRLWRQLNVVDERYRALVAGTQGDSLEEVLFQHLENVRQAVTSAAEAEAIAREVAAASQWHLQHCGIVRFNPFANTGGDQSFCIALADATGRGVIITSLHAREGTRVYAKPLINWESPYPLTDEEKAAIQQATRR